MTARTPPPPEGQPVTGTMILVATFAFAVATVLAGIAVLWVGAAAYHVLR